MVGKYNEAMAKILALRDIARTIKEESVEAGFTPIHDEERDFLYGLDRVVEEMYRLEGVLVDLAYHEGELVWKGKV